MEKLYYIRVYTISLIQPCFARGKGWIILFCTENKHSRSSVPTTTLRSLSVFVSNNNIKCYNIVTFSILCLLVINRNFFLCDDVLWKYAWIPGKLEIKKTGTTWDLKWQHQLNRPTYYNTIQFLILQWQFLYLSLVTKYTNIRSITIIHRVTHT